MNRRELLKLGASTACGLAFGSLVAQAPVVAGIRTAEVLRGSVWTPKTFLEIGAGDVFRLREADGTLADGGEVAVALRDAEAEELGDGSKLLSVDCDTIADVRTALRKHDWRALSDMPDGNVAAYFGVDQAGVTGVYLHCAVRGTFRFAGDLRAAPKAPELGLFASAAPPKAFWELEDDGALIVPGKTLVDACRFMKYCDPGVYIGEQA